jgi:hypothetical protein
MNKKQAAEMQTDIARRTDDMRGRGMPDHIIRAMERHVRDMAEKDAARNFERLKKDNRALRHPSMSQSAFVSHMAASS